MQLDIVRNKLRIVGLENEELSDIVHFPATKRKLLDMLQVRVVAFADRVEIKAVFPIQPIECQLLQPACKSLSLLVAQ